MVRRWHRLGRNGERTMVERMTLAEIIARRARDYGMNRPEELAAATGMSHQHARMMLNGRLKNVGIEGRRGLVKALDLDPDVIERSVRRG